MSAWNLKILFPESKSKFYEKTVKLAKEFDGYSYADMNIVPVSESELHEKWEFFNRLFWQTVDRKGAILEFNDIRYQSHKDKTRIFYALQTKHQNHICNVLDEIAIKRFEFSPGESLNDYRIILN